jgi:Ni,Fe-hydrogenase I cytochrome b subunit
MKFFTALRVFFDHTSADEKFLLFVAFIFPWLLFFFDRPETKILAVPENRAAIFLGILLIVIMNAVGLFLIYPMNRLARRRFEEKIDSENGRL